jgi:cytochrome c oxidase subunit I
MSTAAAVKSPSADSDPAQRLKEIWETPKTLYGWLATVDHKKVAIRYLVTAFAFLLIGGLEALVMRLQLAAPEEGLLGPEAYNQLFSMHGITMIFWYAAPILSGFANYLVPLMLGARDMAFPRLNAFSYWMFLLSGLFLYASPFLGQAPHAGWFAYVPLTEARYSPGLNMDFFALSLILFTISQTAGAINFLVSIWRLRAPGMALHRMPLFMYSTSTTSALSVLAMPALTVACVFLELDRRWGTHFFRVPHGGDPLLWQQAFWFFGHPWVYIVFLPATGMISMLLPVFARRPIVGYSYVAVATVLTGLVGMGVWVHHMFAVGMGQMAMSFFSAASMTISVFSAVQVFAWIGTLWKGRPVMTVPLLFAVGFIANFAIGGLNGVVTAVIPFDWQVHDTYFVVAHLHYVLIGTNLFPVFAGFYYWLPKITGRMLGERLGRWSFWVMFAGFNLAFFPMQLLGLLGMRRRVYTYESGSGWGTLNLLATIGAFILAIGILLSIINFFISLRRGRVAGKDPWRADSLEWSTESPPAPYGSVHIPTVTTRHPLWDDHDEEEDPRGERILDQGRLTLSTSWLDARTVAYARMPEDTAVPLVLSLLLTGLFTAVLLRSLWAAGALALVCFATMGYWLWPKLEKASEKIGEIVIDGRVLPWDDRRGTGGMVLTIVTEALLFVVLFFSYYYLGHGQPKWPTHEAPKLTLAFIMLGVLLLSSAVLHWGERQLRKGERGRARAAVLATIALGAGFLVIQGFEYHDHLKTLLPTTDSYGSIFYTITSFHAAHVLVGVLCLIFVAWLPRLEPVERPPHRPLHNVSLYWHFVDLVWIFVVGLLYVVPNLKR